MKKIYILRLQLAFCILWHLWYSFLKLSTPTDVRVHVTCLDNFPDRNKRVLCSTGVTDKEPLKKTKSHIKHVVLKKMKSSESV